MKLTEEQIAAVSAMMPGWSLLRPVKPLESTVWTSPEGHVLLRAGLVPTVELLQAIIVANAATVMLRIAAAVVAARVIDGIKEEIESTHYANHCISPKVVVEDRNIGELDDSNPLNYKDKQIAEYRRLFAVQSSAPQPQPPQEFAELVRDVREAAYMDHRAKATEPGNLSRAAESAVLAAYALLEHDAEALAVAAAPLAEPRQTPERLAAALLALRPALAAFRAHHPKQEM